MTGQSAVTDYVSIILRAIERAQNDPAQLRLLVYDIARVGLGKQILMNYQELGSAGFKQQLSNLENAIKEVEILSKLESDLIPHDAHLQLLEPPGSPVEGTAVVARDQHDCGEVKDRRQHDSSLVPHPTPLQIYSGLDTVPEFLRPVQVWEPAPAESETRRAADRFRKFELPIAVLIGIAIYAAALLRPDYFPRINALIDGRSAQSAAALAPPNAHSPEPQSTLSPNSNNVTTPTQSLGFSLPSIYGVYAVSAGTLYELQPLALKVPDPRVSISAMVSSPSSVTIPNGKLEFIVYRRDLESSAPDSASIRVFARVMREMKFTERRPPKYVNINGEWAIRSKSYQFGVAPLYGHPEMVMLRSADPAFSFPSGRYVLSFIGQGYDFNVAGQVTDSAQCLERTDAVGGVVYSECRKSP